MKRILIVISFLLLIAQCLKSQNSIFWEVTSPKNGVKSYLLGTYHTLGNHFVDSLPNIKEKLYQSELAVFECVDGDKSVYNEIVMKRKENFQYKDELDSIYLIKIDSLLKDWEIPIAKLKPYELVIKLQYLFTESHCNNIISTDTWSHFDNYLLNLAKEKNIEVYGLETNLEQIKTFEKSLPNSKWSKITNQIYDLVDAIIKEEDDKWYCSSAYQYQKLIEEYNFEFKCDNFLRTKKRNNKWMKELPDKLESKKCFIAVGIAHLRNGCGIILQLRELGFVVAPVSLTE